MQNSGLKNLVTGKAGTIRGIDTSFLLGIGLAAAFVVFLWWTPLLFPFRIMTTTIHEMSHAVAVLLTGGTVVGFDVNPNGSGMVTSTGGWALLLYSAGYLGSTLFGGVMLLVAKSAKGRRDALKWLAIGLVVVLALAGLLRVLRTGNPLNFILFNDLIAPILVVMLVVLLWFLAEKGPDILVTFVAYTLALCSVLYAVFDLINVFTSTVQPWGGFNDAVGLQSATGIPAPIWAGVWCIIAAFILFNFVKMALRPGSGQSGSAQPAVKSPLDKYNNLFK